MASLLLNGCFLNVAVVSSTRTKVLHSISRFHGVCSAFQQQNEKAD